MSSDEENREYHRQINDSMQSRWEYERRQEWEQQQRDREQARWERERADTRSPAPGASYSGPSYTRGGPTGKSQFGKIVAITVVGLFLLYAWGRWVRPVVSPWLGGEQRAPRSERARMNRPETVLPTELPDGKPATTDTLLGEWRRVSDGVQIRYARVGPHIEGTITYVSYEMTRIGFRQGEVVMRLDPVADGMLQGQILRRHQGVAVGHWEPFRDEVVIDGDRKVDRSGVLWERVRE